MVGRNTKSQYKTKYKIMTGTQKVAQNTLNKIHAVLLEAATKSIVKYKISNTILNIKLIQEAKQIAKHEYQEI